MRLAIALITLFLAACASSDMSYKTYLSKKGVQALSINEFSHCHGYGCRLIKNDLKLTDQQWHKLDTLFKKPSVSAEQERSRIASAIGLFEKAAGSAAGTNTDKAGTYRKLGDDQHDCVDESVNTTIYLSLLEQKGHLLYHSISTPSSRIPPFSRGLGPHQSAVIKEKQSGERYAVDSWFHDNGQPAEIVAMDRWFFGWRPNDNNQKD